MASFPGRQVGRQNEWTSNDPTAPFCALCGQKIPISDGGEDIQTLCHTCRTIGGHTSRGSFDNFVGPMLNAVSDVNLPLRPYQNFPFCSGAIGTCPCPRCTEIRLSGRPPLSAPPDFSSPFAHHFPSTTLSSVLSPRGGQDSFGTASRFFPPNLPSPSLPNPASNVGQNCFKHRELELSFFCVTCKQLVCTACRHVYHHYHTVQPIQKEDQMLNFPADIKKISKAEMKLLEESVSSAAEMEEKITVARGKILADIHHVFKQHHDALQQREEALIAQVNAITDLRQESLSEQVRKIKEHLENVKAKHTESEESVDTSSKETLLHLHSHLSIVKATPTPFLYTVLEDDSFILRTEVPRAQDAIKTLCHLTTAAYPPLCVASGEGLHKPRCKELCMVTITTKDRMGALCITGGEPLFAELKGPDDVMIPTNVRDHQNGTYSFTFKPFTQGNHTLTIAIHKQHIQGSPFTLKVENGQEYYVRGVTKVFGSEGKEPGQLNRPWGVAVDQHGNIIIGDRSNHRIQVFDPDGNVKHIFGSEGVRPGQFNRPAGVAVTREGNIVVADKDNHRVQVLTHKGTFLFMFGSKGSNDGQMIYPYDVAVNDVDGRIAVTDTGNHRLLVFSSDGILLGKLGYKGYLCGHFDSPRGIAFCEDGRIVVSDFNVHHVLVIQRDGRTAKIHGSQGTGDGQFKRPQGIAVDHHGNFVIADTRNHRIVIMQSNGQIVTKFGSQGSGHGQFDRPTTVAITPDGHIVVVDFGNSRIQVF